MKHMIVCFVSCCVLLTSCGGFGEGILAGLSGMPNYIGNGSAGGYNNFGVYNSFSGYSSPVGYGATTTYGGSSGNVSSSSTQGGNSSTASSRVCLKSSASDLAHCNGNGKCSKCNGAGKYYDTSFGNPRWVNPCVICNGSGKCPGCNGTGRK